MAQRYKNDWSKESLHSKVKLVRYSSTFSGIETALNTRHLDTSEYWVDTFSNTGRKLGTHRVVNGVITDRIELKFDSNGNMTEQRGIETETGRVTLHIKYSYDPTGNIIKEQSYDGDGKPGRCVKYTYASGLVTTAEISTDEDTQGIAYKYNNKGKIIEEVTYPNCGTKSVYLYDYDDKGNKISAIFRYHATDSKTIWKYDKYNNKVMECRYNPDDTINSCSSTEYIYDSRGNWIHRITTYGKGASLSNRQIEYY